MPILPYYTPILIFLGGVLDILLSTIEARVIGVLIEKEITTPDQYPLSLNSVTLACNQKSNRDPVMNLSEACVQDALDELLKKHFLMERKSRTSRVVKYQQRMVGSDFSVLQLDKREIAILCVLLLRGAQTPGELRTRTQRLYSFADVAEVENVLTAMCDGDVGDDEKGSEKNNEKKGRYVFKLPREAGRRDSRYVHLLSGDIDIENFTQTVLGVDQGRDTSPLYEERISLLEAEVEYLKKELDTLKDNFQASKKG